MDLILAGRKVRKAPRSKELVAAQGSNVDKPRRTDHYLPKESFAEFAIHPMNLLPACTVCNEKKGKVPRADVP